MKDTICSCNKQTHRNTFSSTLRHARARMPIIYKNTSTGNADASVCSNVCHKQKLPSNTSGRRLYQEERFVVGQFAFKLSEYTFGLKVTRSMSQTLSLFILIVAVATIATGQSDDGVQIVTYGEPCPENREYSVELEGPRPPEMEEAKPKVAKIEMRYVVEEEDKAPSAPVAYPVDIEVPIMRQIPEKLVYPQQPCPIIKSYDIKIDVPPPPPPTNTVVRTYDTELEIVPEPEVTGEVRENYSQKPVKLLTGLTSRVDKILIPACQLKSLTSGSPRR